jgi:hypothetical protein
LFTREQKWLQSRACLQNPSVRALTPGGMGQIGPSKKAIPRRAAIEN